MIPEVLQVNDKTNSAIVLVGDNCQIGKNEAGERVASGVYFYTMSAGELVNTRKMVLFIRECQIE